nr:hypothetical protein HK105_000236 [Polyrhizophydium stewartii]
MKHSLVTSLPGVMPHFTIWVVSIFLCLLAAGPVAVYSSFSVASRWSLLATIIVCGCMSSLTWVYIFLAIRNVKEENATIAAALRIVTRKSKLSWWLIYRPILMLLISAGYLAFFILLPQSLDMTAGVAVIVLWDFLFEYKQIQRGLFAKLVREISLPEDARRKLSQARERENAMRKIGDDSNESELYYDDNPADFEFPLDQIAAIRRGRNHDSMKSKISASTSGGLGSAVGPIKTKRESAYTSVGASSSNPDQTAKRTSAFL